MNRPAPSDWRPTAALEVLRLRARLLGRARAYFAQTGALEVETPMLVRAAVTDAHLESLEVRRSDGTRVGFLHTSPEYAMKRLLCAGAPDVYQVAHVFREGERGRRHNPEFTMIEWYRLGTDHHGLMRDVEALLRALLEPLRPMGPTTHVTYAAAFEAGDRDGLLDLGMSLRVAPGFPDDRITFVRDFPASQAALARVDGPVAARFEAFWGGLELANGFHELGDATEQSQRFSSDLATRRARGLPEREMDQSFLAALSAGLPACAGVALGFDRVVMIAAGASTIDEVISFPIERA